MSAANRCFKKKLLPDLIRLMARRYSVKTRSVIYSFDYESAKKVRSCISNQERVKNFQDFNNPDKLRNKNLPFLLMGGVAVFLFSYLRGLSQVQAISAKEQIREKFNFIADIVSDVSPTVVNVERVSKNEFQTQNTVSTGSGFIVKSDGLIITNAHVIGNHKSVKVRLKDGREFSATVTAVDESRDIAAIKISAEKLPVIDFCKLNDIRVGEWVVAIGSPLALKDTVTIGIISNMNRAGKELGLTNTKREIGYIQTDATINVGNSGGPLVNLAGEVIGMNTMMASAGIAFAIPIDYVDKFLERIKKGETSNTRKWIGVRVYSLTQDMIMQIRLNTPDFPEFTQGLYVSSVDNDSPAATAGLQNDDVILTINGNPAKTAKELNDALLKNEGVTLKVQRKDQELEFKVVPEDSERKEDS